MTTFKKFCILAALFSIGSAASAQERAKTAKAVKDGVSCNEFAQPTKQIIGQVVGVEQCLIFSEETVFNIKGQKFRRLEVGLSGGAEGWASREKGSRAIYFTDGPDFVLTQSNLTGPRARGVGRYEASTGHGMTIFYPEDARHWNGKLFITAHGAGSYGAIGALIARDPNSKFHPLTGINRYIGLMIDKGFAVAHTMRSSDRLRGDVTITLEDGAKLNNYNLSSHAGLLTSWTQLARHLVGKRVGKTPARVYFYGHSAGGFLGRQLNYQPGANVADDGKPLFDGFLIDDAGSGLWLPKLVVDGKDTLFTTDEQRARFAKQIDITHMLYAGDTGNFMENKRENARLLLAKGLTSKQRVYEVLGVSHFDAGQISRPDLVGQTLDLGGLFDALIERLDEWVEKNSAPTSNKADAANLVDKNGSAANSAVALPEIACPLGIYFTYPPQVDPGRRGGQETGFAAFDGSNQEPLDGRGTFVDMNGNGTRDKRESVAEAWQRLGLLKAGQKMSSSVYQNCVKNAAGKLVKQGLLPAKVGEYYVDKAARLRLTN